MTRSTKRHTISKSGSSAKSTRTAKHTANQSSSQIAAPSFELDGRPPDHARKRYQELLNASEQRLTKALTETPPQNALLRARWKQRIAKERRQIGNLKELLA